MIPMTKDGILLFAHGARDPAWAQPFEATERALRARAQAQGADVALAFLEFMSPTLLEAGAQLVVLEAMKMEHSIRAPHAGTVKALYCQEGEMVSEGSALVELEEA